MIQNWQRQPKRMRIEVGVVLFLCSVQLLTLPLNFYQRTELFDDIVHFFNPFTVCYFSCYYLYHLLPTKTPFEQYRALLIISLINSSFAALWEIGEWYAFKVLPIDQITIQDTIHDMSIHVVATVVAVIVWQVVQQRLKSKN